MVDFATHGAALVAADIKVIAASVDSVAETADLRDGLRVGFPMFAELDAQQVADATGAFIATGERTMIHGTGFLLAPDGTIAEALYATGPIGRLTPSDVMRKVAFIRRQG